MEPKVTELRGTTTIVREDLIPLVEALCDRAQGQPDQLEFFSRILAGLEAVRDPDDLAGPFMELSTAAFHGFVFAPDVGLLLDRVLEIAQTLSMTLSAPADEVM